RHRAHTLRFHLGEGVAHVGDIAQGDMHALVGERERHGAAQPASRAGDDYDLALEILHCASSQSAASRHRLSRKRSRKKPKWPSDFTPTSPGVTRRVCQSEFGYKRRGASTAVGGANASSEIAYARIGNLTFE